MSFTRIPDKIIDDLRLNPYQFQILSIIIRKTDGWCKVEDGISLSQFEKLVTFKKPKIIATLKDLINMDLIEKKKQFKDNGGNSYSLYKISNTLVTENYKGSKRGLQGVVTEDYAQEKTNTKETKTNTVINDNKEDFLELWKDYTLTFMKSKNRQGGSKSKALIKYSKLRDKDFSKEFIYKYAEQHCGLDFGWKDLERLLTLDLVEQFRDDSCLN